ncbi:MAG: TMEM175 family protein [Candidatus Dormibacteraeota bacterium]|nr:TMEM175 family protein [Candidatus Dormibacteraeota bacterium]
MKTERVQAFSDGVFAVAITLLVLDLIPPPTSTHDLFAALADRWPDFAAFVLSFLTIGIIWVNHHVVFDAVQRVDRPLLFLNLGLLMSVVLLPFSTSLFARFLVQGADQSHVAAAVFSGSLLLMSLWFDAAYAWIGGHPALRRDDQQGTPITLRSLMRFGAGIALYAACVGISFLSATAVLIIQALVAIYYMVDQVTTHVTATD